MSEDQKLRWECVSAAAQMMPGSPVDKVLEAAQKVLEFVLAAKVAPNAS